MCNICCNFANQWPYIICKIICFFSDKQNKENLELIANSMFVLCLDQPIGPVRELDEETQLNGSVEDLNESGHEHKRDDVSLALQLLHGMGSKYNASNRWYDKTMQVNSVTLTCFKHLWVWIGPGRARVNDGKNDKSSRFSFRCFFQF